MVGGSWPVGLGQEPDRSPTRDPGSTWVSGTMGFCPGVALKKGGQREEMMIGSGRTNPLRSQLGVLGSPLSSSPECPWRKSYSTAKPHGALLAHERGPLKVQRQGTTIGDPGRTWRGANGLIQRV